jgi:hypothetical protein
MAFSTQGNLQVGQMSRVAKPTFRTIGRSRISASQGKHIRPSITAGARILFCFPITLAKESRRVTHWLTPNAKIYIYIDVSAWVDFFEKRGSIGGCSSEYTHTHESSRDIREEIGCKISRKHFLSLAHTAEISPRARRELEMNAFLLIICALVRLLSLLSH